VKKFSTFLLTANNKYVIFLFRDAKVEVNLNYSSIDIQGRAIAQADSRRFPAAATRVRAQVR
jgi:hypothetical protein